MTVPAFVINLPRDAERRDHMRGVLRAAGIDAEFVPAVDGRALGPEDWAAHYDRARCLRVYGLEMTASELGCYLSHYRLFERIVAEGMDVALIMEDDIEIAPGFGALVDELVAGPHQDWQVLRLFCSRPRAAAPSARKYEGRRLASLSNGYALYRLNVHVLGAGAYLIKRGAAARMLAYGRRAFMPIDQEMDRFWENGIVPYMVRPLPVRHRDDFASSIGDRPTSRRRDQPLGVRLSRRLQRIVDGVRKRLFVLRRPS